MEAIRQRPVNGDGGIGLDFATVMTAWVERAIKFVGTLLKKV